MGQDSKVVIAGGAGFVGRGLVREFGGWDVVVLSRRDRQIDGGRVVLWDAKSFGDWTAELDGASVVIGLAGAPVSLPWNRKNRELISASRVESSTAIREAMGNMERPPPLWINFSATGYYGDRGEELLEESSAPGTGFLADVCREWEVAAFEAGFPGVRRVAIRCGLVLGKGGGAFPMLRKLSRLGLGGSAGSGRQWVPWIHLQDLCALVKWIVETEAVSGPINGCAPEPVRNGELMNAIRRSVGRPWALPAPTAAIRLLGALGGPDPSLVLSSQRVVPRSARDLGFCWRFADLGKAVENLAG